MTAPGTTAPGPLGVDHLGQLADRLATRAPERLALVGDGLRMTFSELATAVRVAAAALHAAGVGPGDRVPVVDAAGPLALVAVMAAARVGAAAALMNPRLTAGELRALRELAGAGPVCVAGEACRDRLDGPVLGPEILAGSGDQLAAEPPAEAVVLFTSGTTGRPKPVPASTVTFLRRLAPYADPPDPQVRMVCVPIHHVGGLVGAFVSLVAADRLVVQPRFEAGQWLRLVEQHAVESTFLVPTMLARILDHRDRPAADLSSLRSIAYGAAPMPAELIERAVDLLPHVGFVNTFGQTETLGGITLSTPDDHRHPVRRVSVGRLVPGVQVRVVDPATDRDVPSGEVGELLVLSAHNVVDGWQRTGDLVRIDPDGYVYVTGRLSDTINRGGEKFGPVEVEAVLRAHPAVHDVAVVGRPDPELGQRVAALVVAEGVTAEQLRSWCTGRLARYKTPEQLVFADRVPLTDVGKVDRRAVLTLVEAAAQAAVGPWSA